jgi:Fanconi anemia group M protein
MVLIDYRERSSELFRLVAGSDCFQVRVDVLEAGDYVLNDRVVLERKTLADFAASVIDGRLFAQAASLSRLPQLPLVLIEGPRSCRMPRVHPNALKGALLSLLVSWRIPVIFSRSPADSLSILKMLAVQSQVMSPRRRTHRGRSPKLRSGGSSQEAVLASLPGIGPRLAACLLLRFGSIHEVFQAGLDELAKVPGCGSKRAKGIREILDARYPNTDRRR